jgi:predicted acyltransferase
MLTETIAAGGGTGLPRTSAAPAAGAIVKPARLRSLDALRGFDMLMIVGGGAFLSRMRNLTGLDWVDWLGQQQHHATWNGFSFEDFIFPLFLFITGASLVFSLQNGLAAGASKADLYRKAFWRMMILIVLGILQKNRPFLTVFDPHNIRVVSVLGRIGFAGFIATLLYLNCSRMARLGWAAGILLAYYAAMFLIPVPGHGAGNLSLEGNLAGWFDRTFLPGRLLQKVYDENGLLTQLPALCLTVFGTAAGDVLRENWKPARKILTFVLAGVAAIAIGLLWGRHFPINKHLWSSSFIVLTTGISFLCLAAFYGVIDVLRFQRWSFFFEVIGLNALTIYLAEQVFSFEYASNRLFGGLYAPLPEPWQRVAQALGAVVVIWLLLYFMYRKRIFIKI